MRLSPASSRLEWGKPNGWNPKPTAANVGGLFFPQGKSLAIDRTEISPGLLQKIVYAGANNASFDKASENLAVLSDLKVDAKQIERLTERVGKERCAERDVETQKYMGLPLTQRKGKPADVIAPRIAVVTVDGGRIQIVDRSKKQKSKKKPGKKRKKPLLEKGTAEATADEKVTAKQATVEEALPPDDEHRGKHWREDKIAEFMTMESEEHATDPCPEVPRVFVDPARITKLTRELKAKKSAQVKAEGGEIAKEGETKESPLEALQEAGKAAKWKPPEVKTKDFTATRKPWAEFGPMVAAGAWKLGFYEALRKAFVADGAENNWTLWRNHFSSFIPILDIIHAISYVFAAATAGRPFAEGWACYVRWVKWMWAGEVEMVLVELRERQTEIGLPEGEDGETHPRQVVDAALRYLGNHRSRMKYDEYRKAGLPITSSYVESAVKQFNRRVKGSEKFWSEDGAEALLQLRGDYLCGSKPMVEFWDRRQRNETGTRRYCMAA